MVSNETTVTVQATPVELLEVHDRVGRLRRAGFSPARRVVAWRTANDFGQAAFRAGSGGDAELAGLDDPAQPRIVEAQLLRAQRERERLRLARPQAHALERAELLHRACDAGRDVGQP